MTLDDTEKMYIPKNNKKFLKVLIMERNDLVFRFVESVCDKILHPCNFFRVEDCIDIIKYHRSQIFDLVLLRYDGASENTGDCIKNLRSIGIKSPIILIGLCEVSLTHEELLAMGADDIVYKPIQKGWMEEKIKKWCDSTDRGFESSFHRAVRT